MISLTYVIGDGLFSRSSISRAVDCTINTKPNIDFSIRALADLCYES